MRIVGAVLAAFALLTAPSAVAKRLTTAIVVGADGRSAEVPATVLPLDGLLPASPHGRFLLVYPLMERGLPARPARFYPDVQAACGSWNVEAPPLVRNCLRVSQAATEELLAPQLAPFAVPPPRLVRLSSTARSVTAPDNYLAGIELAFDRWRDAERSARPAGCLDVRAVWSRGGRPARFCLAPAGAWVAGKLYPYGPAVGAVADYLRGKDE